jgi:hypothetical protein
MIGGALRTCGVSISVSPSTRPPFMTFYIVPPHDRGHVVVPFRDAGRPSPSMLRALSDSSRAQDRDNRQWRGRLILQQRIRPRHPNTAMVVADLHAGGGSSSVTRAHNGAVPEQDLGIRRRERPAAVQALNDVWTLDVVAPSDALGTGRHCRP